MMFIVCFIANNLGIYILLHNYVIQTTEGRKDLGITKVNVPEILRYALNDKVESITLTILLPMPDTSARDTPTNFL